MAAIRWSSLVPSLLLILLLGAGCAKPPRLKDVTGDPTPVAAGKRIVIMATIEGTAETVASIVGVARDYPSYEIVLNDEGSNGDVEAGDGIWSLATDIPWEAPADTYLIDFTAMDKEGNQLPVVGTEEGRYVFELIVK
jgi:hypothetical protein